MIAKGFSRCYVTVQERGAAAMVGMGWEGVLLVMASDGRDVQYSRKAIGQSWDWGVVSYGQSWKGM